MDPAASDAALAALLADVRSRGEIKRLGARLDREPHLRAAAERAARARGHDPDRPGKHLVRALLDREGAARVRTNPIHIDEGFACLHCGAEVPAGGSMIRDHCPACLRSRHLDVVPGDRAAGCGGLLDPVRFALDHGAVAIHYRCRTCGADWRGRAHPDDAVPPDLDPASLPA
jgi:DNA-directed RNA polymerase subunit RPC12/RpoP